MPNDTITTRFSVDVSQLKKGISEANQQIKLANAQFKAATAGMDDWSKSAEGIQAKLKQLDSIIAAQKSKLQSYREQLERQQTAYDENGKRAAELRKQMQDLADKGVDKTSKEYRLLEQQLASVEKEQESNKKSVDSLKVSILDQEAAIGKSEKEYRNYENALNDVGDETEDLGDETEEAGKKAEKAKDGFTVLKGALANLAADGIKACLTGLKNLGTEFVSTIQDVAAAGDEIDKQSQKIGLSAEAYQKWDYALQLSGASIDNLEGGMKTLNNAFDSAKNGSDSAAEKFERLGLSMSDISDLSREDLFGVVVEQLQNVTDDSEKAALATQFFGKAGQELIPLLNQDAEATKAMLQEAEDYGMVLSDDAVKASAGFADSLTLLKGSLEGVKNNIVAEFLPATTSLIHGFAGVVSGVEGADEELEQGAGDFIKSFSGILPKVTKILSSLAKSFISVAPQILSELLPALIGMIPELLSTINEIFIPLLNVVLENVLGALPVLIPALLNVATELVLQLADFLVNNLDTILDAAITLFMAIIQAIPTIIQKLATALPKIIRKLIQFFRDNRETILKAGIALFMELVMAIPQILGALGEALLEIIAAVYEVLIEPLIEDFKQFWEDIKAVFAKIGEWFGAKFGEAWEAIKNAFSKVGEWFGGLWETIKSKFTDIGVKIGDAVSSAVRGAVNGIITWVENTVNNAIRLINNVINLINKIPGVNIGNLSTISIPRANGTTTNNVRPNRAIPVGYGTMMASGGVLEKGQIGILEGTGAEAVVPLENNKRWVAAVAASMSNEIGRATEYNFTQNIYSPKPLSRIEIYRQTRNQINFAKMKAGV